MTPTVSEPLLTLPTAPGAYRWLYLDVSAGDVTAIVIFMLGSPFSAAYSTGAARGASPLDHCAVNVVVYEGGQRRAWALTERAGASIDGRTLHIGASSWTYLHDGRVCVEVDEVDLQGQPVKVSLELVPACPRAAPLRLVGGQSHHWQPVAARASARLDAPLLGITAHGYGYHDSNWGDELLGGGLPRWRWTRAHGPDDTTVIYEPDSAPAISVHAAASGITVARGPAPTPSTRVTPWALRVPSTLAGFAAGPVGATRVLESSPFYARLETAHGEHQVISEVADFRRFHHPFIRWMAAWRTRRETSA